MRVLVISYLPWRNDINVGNTLTNIFNGLNDKIEFAHIYFRDGVPNNSITSKHFKISEKKLAKSIFNRKPVGEEIQFVPNEFNTVEHFSKKYNTTRRLRWEIFLLLQDLIGVFGVWKSHSLNKFILDFKPDIIFGPLGRVPVSNNLMTYLSKSYNIPLITYPWDDHYSLKKISFSPFFWIKTFIERYYIKKCANQSEFLYTITQKMSDEYAKIFNKECKLLYKGYDFKSQPKNHPKNEILKMIYMGNIGSGRWKVLAKVVEAVKEINKEKVLLNIDIYTFSPVSKKMHTTLNVTKVSSLKKPVASEDVLDTMNSADILLFVEPTSLKEKLFFRLSFSTKLVDYFFNSKCILAIGGKTESMNYLKENDAAIIEYDTKYLKTLLLKIVENPVIVDEYAKKAWMCGFKNHQIAKIQQSIVKDFLEITNNRKIKQTN